jgi:chorismate mutase/prephenate dehydratase
VTNETTDRTLESFRARITELDREIVAAVNRRIELVRELHRYKGEQGIPVRDLERERRLVELLDEANEGPLSREGLERLVEFVLRLVREENAR